MHPSRAVRRWPLSEGCIKMSLRWLPPPLRHRYSYALRLSQRACWPKAQQCGVLRLIRNQGELMCERELGKIEAWMSV